jgi:hypothetical protein
MKYILKDDFFENINEIRETALKCEYIKSNKNTGWKGYRAEITNTPIKNYVKENLLKIDPTLKNMDFIFYFHYSLENTKYELNDFWTQRFHRDDEDYAGVVYLVPNPKSQSGTIVFDENDRNSVTIENVYNRLILYNGNLLHGVEDTFGNDIEDGRMTLTIFGTLKNKQNKTML